MMRLAILMTCFGVLTAAGCTKESENTDPSSSAVDGSKFLLKIEPQNAAGVIKVRQESKDKDDVVVIGRIGGRENPWIKGRAAFTIVDPSLKSCTEVGSDGCEKPWDFC